MQNLAHSASFESLDKDAPSKAETKHLEDFENGVPGVTMLTVVVDERKRREYLDRAKLLLRRNLR
jgi:hypothetical protein